MVKEVGISSVQRIWRAHKLQPHRVRSFELSRDPKLAAKLQDTVPHYVDPPAHAIVLSVDEKSQIQALDRIQPGLPLKPGRFGTLTHDDKRNGTTTLFAALDVLESKVPDPAIAFLRHDIGPGHMIITLTGNWLQGERLRRITRRTDVREWA